MDIVAQSWGTALGMALESITQPQRPSTLRSLLHARALSRAHAMGCSTQWSSNSLHRHTAAAVHQHGKGGHAAWGHSPVVHVEE